MSVLSRSATHLRDAAIAGDLAQVCRLLDGISKDPQDRAVWDIDNAFVMAAACGKSRILEVFSRRAPGEYRLDYALQLAAVNNHLAAVDLLLSLGANAQADDQQALFSTLAHPQNTAVIARLARNADLDAIADRLIDQGYDSRVDLVAPYASEEQQAIWVMWHPAAVFPWLHANASSKVRSKALAAVSSYPQPGMRRPRA